MTAILSVCLCLLLLPRAASGMRYCHLRLATLSTNVNYGSAASFLGSGEISSRDLAKLPPCQYRRRVPDDIKLILKRSSLAHVAFDDYDVLSEGKVVGRIYHGHGT